jgi:hypothetical protein
MVEDLPSSITSINLITPNGGEILSNSFLVTWDVINPSTNATSVTIQYKNSQDIWINIVEDFENLDESYNWDTSTVSNGVTYWLKVILKEDSNSDGVYETIIDEDTSDSSFEINNYVPTEGWIYGWVTENKEDSEVPIEDAIVCVTITKETDSTTNKCVYTDEDGEYTVTIPIGTYTISASKDGYVTATVPNTLVQGDLGTLVNFSLEKSVGAPPETFFEYALDEETEKGTIIGTVDITTDQTEVSLYKEITIEVLSKSQNELKVKVSGEGEGGRIVIQLTGQVESVKYDGIEIPRSDNIESFFEYNLNPEYIIISTDCDTSNDGTQYIIVNVPTFSEHEITITSISEIIDVLGGTTALIYYIIISIIATIIFAGSIQIRRKI